MRRLSSEKYRLLGWICGLLIIGFLTTITGSYIVSRDTIRQNVVEQSLPLTSDNIYSEIQKDLLRPAFISSLMASDTFVRDWILNGEAEQTQIVRYLKEVKQKYGMITAFLVSDRTHHYYYADGMLKTVDPNEHRDVWYFRVREMKNEYEINVDIDMANRDAMTIFLNHRVLDYRGNFIGAAGVGLTLDTMAEFLDSYQTRFHRTVYFTDREGQIMLSGRAMRNVHGRIGDLPGISAIARDILNHDVKPTSLEYTRNGETVLLSSRFIPELDWYLLVEQTITEDVQPVRRMLAISIAISAIVSILILVLTLFAVNRYQARLQQIAGTDALTGLLNRQAFELVFRQAVLDSERRSTPLSAILFDIDFFKTVNDNHGHLVGDHVLQQIAELARKALRESDIVTRWGGEEFLILLKDCPLEQAHTLAEKLRQTIAAHRFVVDGQPVSVSISLGVTQYSAREQLQAFFARADKALYEAKREGRNRVNVSLDIHKQNDA